MLTVEMAEMAEPALRQRIGGCTHDGRPGRRPAGRTGSRRPVVPAPRTVAWTRPPAGRRTRVTRRGRLLLVLALAALLLAAFSAGRVSTAAHAAGSAPALRHVTVSPGETLWQLAVRLAPQNDPRVTVTRLMQLNHLSSPALQAGQTLLVPGR